MFYVKCDSETGASVLVQSQCESCKAARFVEISEMLTERDAAYMPMQVIS